MVEKVSEYKYTRYYMKRTVTSLQKSCSSHTISIKQQTFGQMKRLFDDLLLAHRNQELAMKIVKYITTAATRAGDENAKLPNQN